MMGFLYEMLDNPIVRGMIKQTSIPDTISSNLKYPSRPYQEEAFQRFLYVEKNDFPGKPIPPYHYMFNMATGSGKTLVMAGLILHLYGKGYRNFLFFVNSTNIIRKTKDNFLNSQASKYLYKDKVIIDGEEVQIKEVENFDAADDKNINIKFTTVQKLHGDLNETKENSVTYEDFEGRKIVLIADEAHHLNAASKNKQKQLYETWEDTVNNILSQNSDNILLEFTATLDYENVGISEKYKEKVLFRYDLAEFRRDKYSKEINLLRSDYEVGERILLALILNLYRQELATSHGINLKPVILFKAKSTIAESKKNKEYFHHLIDNLTPRKIGKIRKSSSIDIIKRAFTFFQSHGIGDSEIVRRTKSNFRFENCLSANNDEEAERNQILLNTLEDKNNPIRAIFAVQKLNEGWDVLNLFDIVRLYQGRDGKNNRPGKTTIAEAQLIGRGARYFPFALDEEQDKYTRKFDDNADNDLKILEDLYYHTREDSRYISELKKALRETGIIPESDLVTKKLKLKPSFKKTKLYKEGRVFANQRVLRDHRKILSFADLGVNDAIYEYRLASGAGRVTKGFSDKDVAPEPEDVLRNELVEISEIPHHIIRHALSKNPFFHFSSLSHYFPAIPSTSHFIESKDYLAGLSISFRGTRRRLDNLTPSDQLGAVDGLLKRIKSDIDQNITEYEGGAFYSQFIHDIFKDKEIRMAEDSERADGQESTVKHFDWYAFNANYGTDQEKHFVKFFDGILGRLTSDFEDIYVLRNERELKIFNQWGRAFEPDFLLFCKRKNGEQVMFQMFIEPKGEHLMAQDKWKEDFLKEIQAKGESFGGDFDKYKVTGIPFYNSKRENEIKQEMLDALEIE